MEDTKIQWHPGFTAAMMLELKENREDLIFEKEYNLNTKPLEIDLLVIRKEAGVMIANEIGEFFRIHNIIEYKSPGDHLDIDDFYKVQGYASLYKSYGKYVDERKSRIWQRKDSGKKGTMPFPGIRHIKIIFPGEGSQSRSREKRPALRSISTSITRSTCRGKHFLRFAVNL